MSLSKDELNKLISDAVTKAFSTQTLPGENTKVEQFLSRQETADLLKISLVTLHDWVNHGVLKSYKLQRRVYFKKEEVMATLNSAKMKGGRS